MEKQVRKSYISLGNIYFWTATINNWKHLLATDKFKNIIIESLSHLSVKGKIDVFAFVIMPNHIHLIWRINANNGKETTVGSFLKYTAHEFKKTLKTNNPEFLSHFAINASNKNYEFWQRDSLAIELFSKKVAFQKLDYIHNNPLSGRWNLVKESSDYQFSSAKFYEKNINNFLFLKDIREEF